MRDSDTGLMERIRDGDANTVDAALAELVERYQHELVGFFYHHCWNQAVAEELAQSVFVKLYRARERYQATAKVRTYLYRIAHNAWIDHLRRQRPHASLDAQVGGSSGGANLGDLLAAPAATMSLGEREARDERIRTRVQQAVEKLNDGQREVFILANHQQMRYHEIAAVLGIPEGTVKSRMHAAVRTLRDDLTDLLDEMEP